MRSDAGYQRRMATAQFVIYVLLVVVCLLSLAPMIMMVMNSFKSDDEMLINPGGLPWEWTLSSYRTLLQYHGGVWRNFANSVIVSGASTLGALLLCSMAAYAFSKYRFKGRGVMFALLLSTMMVPVEITIPARYIMFAKLRWLNSLQVQILPRLTPMVGLFLIRQYMLEIPDELMEAAHIDGAGHFATFRRVMLPVCAPVLGAFAILHFMNTWNHYTWPSIAVIRTEMQPIMVVLPQLVDAEEGWFRPWGTIMAGCTLSTIPILAVFIRNQETFMSSVVIGAVKG